MTIRVYALRHTKQNEHDRYGATVEGHENEVHVGFGRTYDEAVGSLVQQNAAFFGVDNLIMPNMAELQASQELMPDDAPYTMKDAMCVIR